jgi:hypothetical protein
MEKWKKDSMYSLLLKMIKLNDEIQAPAALFKGIELPVSTKQKAGRAPGPIWTL